MKLTQQQIADLVQGKTVQVVVLKKEGDDAFYPAKGYWKGNKVKKVPKGSYFCVHSNTQGFRVKFQVGKDYAISKPELWYCPKHGLIEGKLATGFSCYCYLCRHTGSQKLNQLRFVVKSIKSQGKNWILKGVKK